MPTSNGYITWVESVRRTKEEQRVLVDVLRGRMAASSLLTDRQRAVLTMYFGLADGTRHTLEQIGQKMGISRERVRQVLKQGGAKSGFAVSFGSLADLETKRPKEG